jgi:superkiller protein 3
MMTNRLHRRPRSCLLAPSLPFALLLASVGLIAGCAPDKGKAPTALGGASNQPAGVDYYIQARQAAQAGRTDEEIMLLEKAVAANPNLRMAQAMLADAYRARGDFARAAPHYQIAARQDRYNFSAHYGLGLSLQLLNRLEESAVAYLRALELNPRDVNSNINLGLVFLAMGKLDQAEQYVRRATDLDRSNAMAWLNLAVVLDTEGKTQEAESTYRRALELDSRNVTIIQDLAQNLVTQQKGDEAVTLMEQVVVRSDSAMIRKQYGDAFAATKEWDHAIAQYDAALRFDPRFVPAMNEKGFALIRKYVDGLELNDKQRQTALDLWRASLKINPNQPRIIEAIKKWEHPSLFGN